MNPTKAFCQPPELIEGEGQLALTKLCPACIKAFLKDALLKNCLALGVAFGVCERAKELTKPSAGERSITARHCIFEEVVKIQPYAGSCTGNHKHCVTQGHSVIFSHDASERHLEEAIKLIEQDGLQSLLSVLFLAPKGEMDWFAAKTKGSSTVLGGAFVVIQCLLLLQPTSQH
jgi:hypothetical protein